MKTTVYYLTNLYDPRLELVDIKGSKYKFVNLSKELSAPNVVGEVKLILADGSVTNSVDINKVYDNRETIINIGLDTIREKYNVDEYTKEDNESISPLSKFMQDNLEKINMYSSTAANNDDHYLAMFQCAIRVTSCYLILGKKFEEVTSDETYNEILRNTIKEIREEEEENVTNELEMVNQLLKNTLGSNDDIQIESATYNGEEVEAPDITYKLSTHMLPEYLTQVDIRQTLDDEYTIVTNKCIIKRSKGGNIEILDK